MVKRAVVSGTGSHFCAGKVSSFSRKAMQVLKTLEELLPFLYWVISITKPCGSSRAGVPTL